MKPASVAKIYGPHYQFIDVSFISRVAALSHFDCIIIIDKNITGLCKKITAKKPKNLCLQILNQGQCMHTAMRHQLNYSGLVNYFY